MKVFTHRTFGVINVVMFNSKEYFDAISVTRILGYANRHDAINKHCNKEGVMLQEIGIECGEDRSGDIDIGRNRLYSWLRDKGYLMKSKQERNNPKQRYIESGLFKVRERIVTTRKGAKVVVTPFIACKGQLYLLEAIKKDFVR